MVSITLIPTKKSLIILLTILFSAAIFSTSSSIIFSINNFNEYLYGDQSNVLVIYDQQAQTPFTSRVPASFDLILNQIQGVETTSPELMIPGVVRDQSLLLRGVNLSGFRSISQINLIEGEGLTTGDRSTAIIGKSLASRLDLQTGDSIYYQGSLKNNGVYLKINGIFEGSDELEDELIVPLATAEKLSRRTGEYNHIKVKFDPVITSRGEILNLITSSYPIDIQLYHENNTEVVSNYELQIYDADNDLLVDERVTDLFSLDLPFGEYRFIFSKNSEILLDSNRFVNESDTFEFSLPDYSYSTTIGVNTSNYTGKIGYSIYNSTTYQISTGFISSTDPIMLNLPQDSYSMEFITPTSRQTFPINIDQVGNLSFDINISAIPSIVGLSNSSEIPRNGTFMITNFLTGLDYQIMIDQTPYEVNKYQIPYNLTQGEHELSILEDDILVNSIHFTANSSISTTEQQTNQFQSIQLVSNNQNIGINSSYIGYGNIDHDDISLNFVTNGSIYMTDQSNLTLEQEIVSISENTILSQYEIVYTDKLIDITNDLGITSTDITIEHEILPYSTNVIKIDDGWQANQVPIGQLQITIDRLNKQFTINTTVSLQEVPIRIVLDPIQDVSIDKFLAVNSQIDADIATDFFNQELTGPFAFFRIALLAESIIIIFLLLINVSGVYAGVVSEHRHELRTLRSIGFSTNEMILSIIRGSLYLSIPTIVAGSFLGLGLANLLLITDNTVLFGHRFVPRFPVSYWIFNLVVGHLLIYFGAFVGLKLEEKTIN